MSLLFFSSRICREIAAACIQAAFWDFSLGRLLSFAQRFVGCPHFSAAA
jgi:hypothetical protein